MKIDVVKSPDFQKMKKTVDVPANKMQDVMMNLRSDTQKRLDAGRDQNGKSFKGYSTGTKNRKSKIGKGSTVNMEDSGIMRRGVQRGKVKENYGELVLRDHKDVGYWHQTGKARGGKKREWFGADKKSENKAIKFITNWIKKQVAKL